MSARLPGADRAPRAVLPGLFELAPARRVDVLIVGAGIAGLSVALSLPEQLVVEVALKGRTQRVGAGSGAPDADGSSGHAQGGIAAVFGADDSPALHHRDTLAAGAGLCEEAAVQILVEEAPAAVRFLEGHGVHLDAPGGAFDLTREGGHSRRRVVHAGGDATGHEVMRALTGATRDRAVRLCEGAFLVDLLTDGSGAVCGAVLLEQGRLRAVLARAVVLGTGGFGQLFAETTSPVVCTGDGIAAAFRAGAELADLEFVQFHPTAIQLSSDPRPLASEALRGEGAVIRDRSGRAVMAGIASGGDLAPRDVVSRAMALEMRASGADHLFLDATEIGPAIAERFPNFVGASRRAGIDPTRTWVPIAPAVHYVMGGVRTDRDGRTSLPGLYAAGEVAQSGVHGANRLASNSLVEGVVFGRRAAQALAGELVEGHRTSDGEGGGELAATVERGWLRQTMTERAGVLRSRDDLRWLLGELEQRARPNDALRVAVLEDANLLQLARLVAVAACRREESRGAHFRLDVPESSPAWLVRQCLRREADGAVIVDEVAVSSRAPGAPELSGSARR